MTNYGKHKSNAFVALEQSEEYNYTQTKVKAVINASKSFNVSEEEAAEKLGYSVAAYEVAKKNQNIIP